MSEITVWKPRQQDWDKSTCKHSKLSFYMAVRAIFGMTFLNKLFSITSEWIINSSNNVAQLCTCMSQCVMTYTPNGISSSRSRSLIKVKGQHGKNQPYLGCNFYMHLYIIKIIMAQVIILMRLYFTCKIQDTYAMSRSHIKVKGQKSAKSPFFRHTYQIRLQFT